MGCGLPGALASNIAYPGRQAIAITGDGAFQMVMQDFATRSIRFTNDNFRIK